MTKDQTTAWDIAESCFNTINHVMIGTIGIYLSFFCAKVGLSNVKSLHALLCALGVS